MNSLDSTFRDLRRQLGSRDRLTPTHVDPYFHLVHRPEETFEVRRRLPRWRSALEEDRWTVRLVCLGELLWQVVDQSGRWEDWLEVEEDGDRDDVLGAVRDSLRSRPESSRRGLADAVVDLVASAERDTVLLLTDAGLLHPFFRVRAIEARLHDRVRGPTVLFYPGRRAGQYGLHFLGFYREDGNYRSRILGDAL